MTYIKISNSIRLRSLRENNGQTSSLISVEDYITTTASKHLIYMPHTAGMYQAKRFRKAQCPVVERLTNSLMMQRRDNGKKSDGCTHCEGTSGLKPADKKNDDENILTVLQEDLTQSSPGTSTANIEETAKINFAEANVGDENRLRDDDSKQTQSDKLNDLPNGHPCRKARKVCLLIELLCKNTEAKK